MEDLTIDLRVKKGANSFVCINTWCFLAEVYKYPIYPYAELPSPKFINVSGEMALH